MLAAQLAACGDVVDDVDEREQNTVSAVLTRARRRRVRCGSVRIFLFLRTRNH